MSILTTTPLKSAPSAAAGVAVAASGIWAYSTWVEVIASTAAPIAIAGLQYSGGSFSARWYEVEIGTGAAGAEVGVGTLRLYLYNSGAGGIPTGLLLPLPLGGIGAGVRVAVRVRAESGTGPTNLALNYYENPSSDHVTSAAHVLSSSPSGSGTLVSLTPSATPWANSAWGELLASAPADLGLLGVAYGALPSAADGGVEFDLGTGAAGSEVVLTTLRTATTGGFGTKTPYTWLPGVYPISAGTRLAVRMRKSDTSTGGIPVAVLYYRGLSAGPDPISGTGAVTVGLALDGSGTATLPAIAGAGDVIFGAPGLSGSGDPVAFYTRATQVVAELLTAVPAAPVAATHVAAELIVQAPLDNAARVTQLACELLIIRVTPPPCAASDDFPVDDVPGGAACPVDDFPI